MIATFRIYEELSNHFQICMEREKNAQLENLTILGLINKIRFTDDESRKLYSSFILMRSVERKLYLDENFVRFSKYRIIKIVGLSLPIIIPNSMSYMPFEEEELFDKGKSLF